VQPLNYEPTPPSKPPAPPTQWWIWGLLAIYAAGVALLIWCRPHREVFGAIEGWTCLFVVPAMFIGGIAYGAQDKDLWT
jgi:hypothetical protein